jgi:glycosyltransferase involved in cell wall biosynthesis
MNILYVVNDFFPRYYGGVERYVLNVGKQMQRMGHRVKVLTYGMEDIGNGYSKRGDIFIKHYVYETIPVISVRHVEIPGDIGYRIHDDILGENLYDLLKGQDIDVIHMGHPMKFSPIVNVAKNLGVPVLLTLTDFWLLCPRGRFFKPDYSPCNSPAGGHKCMEECGFEHSVLERYQAAEKLFRSVDRLIAPSRFISKIFEMNGWQGKIDLVRHGVDYRYVKPAERKRRRDDDPIVLGYTGLITKFKGVDLLVESFRKVRSDKVCLQLYGDVYMDWIWEREFFERFKKTVRKDARIQLMGKYSHDELRTILNRIDVNIAPSTTLESYGLVVTESLSYRVPVIASDIVGSAYEYITDGVNGFIFSINSPDRLTEIIEQIVHAPHILDNMRQNIVLPPRIEEEAFLLEGIYKEYAR